MSVKTKFKTIHISMGRSAHSTPPYFEDVYLSLWASRRDEDKLLDEFEEAYGEEARDELECFVDDGDIWETVSTLESLGYNVILHGDASRYYNYQI